MWQVPHFLAISHGEKNVPEMSIREKCCWNIYDYIITITPNSLAFASNILLEGNLIMSICLLFLLKLPNDVLISFNAYKHIIFLVSHVGVVSRSLCQYSREIVISSCNGLSSVIPSNAIRQAQKIEVLRVEECESFTEVFETQYINSNSGDGKTSININEEIVSIDSISRQANTNVA
ncbi:hypothetical protein R6Q57_011314 [Mikania cordata]